MRHKKVLNDDDVVGDKNLLYLNATRTIKKVHGSFW